MALNKGQNVFLIGPMGAGKSTIGKQLASLLHLEFVDSDKEIEERTGAEISWIFDVEGEEGFRKREQSVLEELTQQQAIVLATGGGAVLRKENRSCLAARGAVIYLETSIEQQIERTRRDRKRPLLQTDNVEERIHELMHERELLYREIADFVVATDGRSVKAVATEIVRLLERQ